MTLKRKIKFVAFTLLTSFLFSVTSYIIFDADAQLGSTKILVRENGRRYLGYERGNGQFETCNGDILFIGKGTLYETNESCKRHIVAPTPNLPPKYKLPITE